MKRGEGDRTNARVTSDEVKWSDEVTTTRRLTTHETPTRGRRRGEMEPGKQERANEKQETRADK